MFARATHGGDGGGLVIGLVNNMPPKAMRSTEMQFGDLLRIGSAGRAVTLRVFANPDIAADMGDGMLPFAHYEDIDALWDSELDGLIVTGSEPQAASMIDEPFWPVLERLVGWARDRTLSTVWSCLAAHAAVRQLDGIERQPMGQKLSGVFDCGKGADHRLTADAPWRWKVPHSRHNGLNCEALLDSGYTILSHAPRGGVDMFARQEGRALFLLLQGHPEYSPGCLMREYRRDIRRFLSGASTCFPALPENYFGPSSETALLAWRERLLREPCGELPPGLEAALRAPIVHSWRQPAIGLYSAWLSYLAERKAALGGAAAGRIRQRAMQS